MGKLTVLILLFSAPAFGCPDLGGNYSCTYFDGSTELVTISQSEKDSVTIYLYNGSRTPADNQVYQMPDDEMLRRGTFRAWCDPSNPAVLRTQVTGKYYAAGEFQGDLILNVTLSRQGRDLKQETEGMLKSSGAENPINGEMVCPRNKTLGMHLLAIP